MTALSLVYLAQAGDLYKVGVTGNLKQRLMFLRSELKMPITLLKTWTSPDAVNIEYMLHTIWATHRIYSEWYRLSNQDLERLIAFNLHAKALVGLAGQAGEDFYLHHILNIHLLTCCQCSKTWIERASGPPLRCPHCKSTRWRQSTPAPNKRKRHDP